MLGVADNGTIVTEEGSAWPNNVTKDGNGVPTDWTIKYV